jgi:hypothetical protein
VQQGERRLSRPVRAREEQADKLFREIIEIADDASGDYVTTSDGKRIVDHENIQRSRLRVDARKWAAARLAPKKYGDHISHDVKGPGPTSSRRSLSPWMVSRTMSSLDSLYTTKAVASYSTATEILCERAEPEFRCRIGPCVRTLDRPIEGQAQHLDSERFRVGPRTSQSLRDRLRVRETRRMGWGPDPC